MVMSKYTIFSNTDFDPRCSRAKTSETFSSSLRVNPFPLQCPVLLLAAEPPLGKTQTDTSQHKVLLSLLLPGVLMCLTEAALLSAGLEPCSNKVQRKGCSHSSFLFSKREATYWCLLGYCFPMANATSPCGLRVLRAPHNQDYRETHAHSNLGRTYLLASYDF